MTTEHSINMFNVGHFISTANHFTAKITVVVTLMPVAAQVTKGNFTIIASTFESAIHVLTLHLFESLSYTHYRTFLCLNLPLISTKSRCHCKYIKI